eukprot:Rmarinus@m.596
MLRVTISALHGVGVCHDSSDLKTRLVSPRAEVEFRGDRRDLPIRYDDSRLPPRYDPVSGDLLPDPDEWTLAFDQGLSISELSEQALQISIYDDMSAEEEAFVPYGKVAIPLNGIKDYGDHVAQPDGSQSWALRSIGRRKAVVGSVRVDVEVLHSIHSLSMKGFFNYRHPFKNQWLRAFVILSRLHLYVQEDAHSAKPSEVVVLRKDCRLTRLVRPHNAVEVSCPGQAPLFLRSGKDCGDLQRLVEGILCHVQYAKEATEGLTNLASHMLTDPVAAVALVDDFTPTSSDADPNLPLESEHHLPLVSKSSAADDEGSNSWVDVSPPDTDDPLASSHDSLPSSHPGAKFTVSMASATDSSGSLSGSTSGGKSPAGKQRARCSISATSIPQQIEQVGEDVHECPEGFLEMEVPVHGGLRKEFQKRFFAVIEDRLFWFHVASTTGGGMVCEGCIPIRRITRMQANADASLSIFAVRFDDEHPMWSEADHEGVTIGCRIVLPATLSRSQTRALRDGDDDDEHDTCEETCLTVRPVSEEGDSRDTADSRGTSRVDITTAWITALEARKKTVAENDNNWAKILRSRAWKTRNGIPATATSAPGAAKSSSGASGQRSPRVRTRQTSIAVQQLPSGAGTVTESKRHSRRLSTALSSISNQLLTGQPLVQDGAEAPCPSSSEEKLKPQGESNCSSTDNASCDRALIRGLSGADCVAAPRADVSIPLYYQQDGVTYYLIRVKSMGWLVARRYSEFVRLHSLLRQHGLPVPRAQLSNGLGRSVRLPPLPPKVLSPQPEVLEMRRAALEEYAQALVLLSDSLMSQESSTKGGTLIRRFFEPDLRCADDLASAVISV